MIDGQHPEHLDLMENELYKASLRINQKKPDVVVAKRGQGGITVNSTTKLTHLNENVIKAISFRIYNKCRHNNKRRYHRRSTYRRFYGEQSIRSCLGNNQ